MQQENCTAQLGQWLAGSENGSDYAGGALH